MKMGTSVRLLGDQRGAATSHRTIQRVAQGGRWQDATAFLFGNPFGHPVRKDEPTVKDNTKLWIARVAAFVFLSSLACDSDKKEDSIFASDAGQEGTDETSPDGGHDAAVPTDGGKDTDTHVPPEPGNLGMPCWDEDVFEKWHPNSGLPDCEKGFKCIGNTSEAWCTKLCDNTGDVNSEGIGIDGFCCGELASPCEPQLYWLPESMDYHCIPRRAGFAQTCDLVATTPSDASRCAPACSDKTELFTVKCAPIDTESGFCTFECDPLSGDGDCLVEPAFEGGCCGEIMGGNWCLPPDMCP